MAGELSLHWDELPGHRFTGRLARAPGVLGAVLPGRRVPHRVVLARYVASTVPRRTAGGYLLYVTVAAVLGLGADGVLRAGRLNEAIQLAEGTDLPDDAVRWDDERIRRLPSRTVWMSHWRGSGEPADVAAPRQVLDALAALAQSAASSSLRDLELLQRLLGTPGAG